MRMRKKPNLDTRLEKSAAALTEDPKQYRGRWLEAFPGHKMLAIELGCGKGRFTADTAEAEPELLIAAVERVPEAIVVGMERALRRNLENIRFLDMDAAKLGQVFAPGEADRIYVNFCDPWPSNGRARRRLTAPDFLNVYRTVLKPGGELRFKTDNVPLFDWSVEQIRRCGWEITFCTHDLHHDGVCEIMTDYEAKFHAQGVPICKCVARTPLKAGLPVDIEERRPRRIFCLPELPKEGERSFPQRRMMELLKAAVDKGEGAVNIGWLNPSGEGYIPDESSISLALYAAGLDEAAQTSLMLAGCEPETLPGAKYALFTVTGTDFMKSWALLCETLTDRGYCIDAVKPIVWDVSAKELGEGSCRLAIPVKNEL